MLPDWLHQRASLTPERLALVASGARWNFWELNAHVSGAAAWLQTLGVQSSERVAVLARNSANYVVLVHAISRAGAVLVPLNTRLTPAELLWQINHLGAKLLLIDEAHAQTAQVLAQQTPLRVESLNQNFTEYEIRNTPLIPNPYSLTAIHSILFTSGTTGQPKGAQLTFGNHFFSAVGSALNLGLHADDVWLACLPLFHVGGLSILLRGIIYGIPVVVHESFDEVEVNRAIVDERVTIISVVSAMLQKMLGAGLGAQPTSLRCVLLGGGPAPRPLLEECAARGLPVVQTYGLTEAASQVATLAPEDALRKLGSAGKPLLPTELKIENPDVGGVGEIVVRGLTVTPGYYANEQATAHVLREGWLHTGDIGYLDDEGYLYVLDRRDDLIISGGENVYPAEIEAVLLSHPAIAEAGVTGAEDARWGQVPVAYIALRAGETLTEIEVKEFCAARLARYKIPAQVKFVEALPRNAAGKLLRRALK
jgi:O-succinylbenzoic acid--CoA ligase